MNQQLFDPKTTTPAKCKVCGTTRRNLCKHDADIAEGYITRLTRRPKSCLNQTPAYDPATAAFPKGF